jgi:hypothetical protein
MRQIVNEVGYFCNIAARQVTGHGLKKVAPLWIFKNQPILDSDSNK